MEAEAIPPAHWAAGRESRNRMRWHGGSRGAYEAWYLCFNDPATGRGWWIRYSMLAPSVVSVEPRAQVWFMRTDRLRDPRNRAIRSTYPLSALNASGSPFHISIQDSELTLEGSRGWATDGDGQVSWQLSWESVIPPFTPTPEWGARLATCYTEPHPLLRVSGWVEEDGRREQVDGLLGEQAHVFGARHSSRWHWAECKHLGAENRAFVGVAAWPALPGPPRSVTSLFLDLDDGRPLLRNRTMDLLRPRTRHEPAGWHFDAVYAETRLVGSVVPRPEDLVGVTYHDPSGGRLFCYHSELADIELELSRRQQGRWQVQEHLRAESSSTFEYGSAEPLRDVPLLLD
jgi:hypothetical protein